MPETQRNTRGTGLTYVNSENVQRTGLTYVSSENVQRTQSRSHYRPSVGADIDYLLAHMRPEDEAECVAGGSSPAEALAFGFARSNPCLTLVEPGNGAPAAMLGVTPSDYECAGKIWLLGTDAIERFPMTFLRNSKPLLERLYGPYTLLYNFTDCRNELHHKWLKWLGFVFLRKVELTPDKLFYEFVRPRAEPVIERP